MILKSAFLILLLHFGLFSHSQNGIIRANRALVQSIMEDNFNPPVASRVHMLANVAAYEVFCLSPEFPYQSLSKFAHLSSPPNPQFKIIPEIAALSSFVETAKKYIYTEAPLITFYTKEKEKWHESNLDSSLISHSIQYGEMMAKHIIEWSKGDNYNYTRTLHRYELSDSLGAWKPTPPEYNNGLEPNWYYMRQITKPKDSFYQWKPNLAYSEDKRSPYYQNALALYQTWRKLSPMQRDIAAYWDDNPMTTVSQGHVMYVVKKPSPVGHWLKITAQELERYKVTVDESSALFTMVAIAAYDAFINCWYVKYQTNAVRPETYIQRVIDADYKPLIETPPFPEYTSGHSTVSSSIANILHHYFPQTRKTGFTDTSQILLGMKPRKFKTHLAASQEASMSRFYGGIHYMPSLDEGFRVGQSIGTKVRKLMMKKERRLY